MSLSLTDRAAPLSSILGKCKMIFSSSKKKKIGSYQPIFTKFPYFLKLVTNDILNNAQQKVPIHFSTLYFVYRGSPKPHEDTLSN